MKIGMIVAMDKELKQLRPLFPEDKVILQKSGIDCHCECSDSGSRDDPPV